MTLRYILKKFFIKTILCIVVLVVCLSLSIDIYMYLCDNGAFGAGPNNLVSTLAQP